MGCFLVLHLNIAFRIMGGEWWRITVSTPRSSQLMYNVYIRVAVQGALSCSATAPKIFAIGSITDKNSCRNFARLSACWFDWVGHPHPKRKHIRSVLINVLCNFEDGTRAAMAASKSSVGLDGCTRMRGVLLRSCHAGEVA